MKGELDMFCKHCSYEVTEEMIVCPNCGKELSNEDVSSEANDIEKADTSPETVEAEIIAPVYHNEDMNRGSQVHDLRYAVKPNVTEVPENQSLDELPEGNEEIPKELNKALLLIPVIIVLVIILLIALNKDDKKNNQTPIDKPSTTQALATESDSTTQVTLVPTDDTRVEAVPIVINEQEIQPSLVKNYTVDNTDVTVTELTYAVSSDDARLYMDTEETKYQLSDEILDVAYVNGIFRYHYAGVYKYGLYVDNLIIVSIPDTVTVDEADKIATGLFNKEAK